MAYMVFDTSINRVMGVYETEDDALSYVRALLRVNDADFADDLAIAEELRDGRYGAPLTGADLVTRAEEVAALGSAR